MDEALNRLTIGIQSEDVRRQVEAKLTELGVPLSVANFKTTGPIRPMVDSLSFRKRPLEGGRQILGAGGYCTLGFPVYWGGTKAFITNSHCTRVEWDSDGQVFYQNDGDDRVGYETYDPRGKSCGFLSVNKCRYADAAVIRVDDTVSISLGYIAQTWSAAVGPGGVGSFEINSYQPQLRITGEGAPIGGEYLDKIGRSTGWTYGRVTQTCTDTNTANVHHWLRCQDWVAAGVNIGDSGSPAFKWWGDGTVTLKGIVWGQRGTHIPTRSSS